ncbi:MAG: hypothetical protein ABI151_02065, partial [Chitinophagaceae bacterium]
MSTFKIMLKQATCAFLVCLLITGCKQKDKNSFVINLNYQNLDKMKGFDPENGSNNPEPAKPVSNPKILLEEIPYGQGTNPVILDSGRLVSNSGKLVLKGNGKEEGIFQITIENGP